MRRLALLLALTLPLAPHAHADKPRKPRPALPAAQYPQHDEHPKEKITIAAEPGDIDSMAPNTRLDYLHHGFLPIRVIITNDSDKTVTLDDARIQFVAADQTVVPAATDEELERRLFSRKSTAPTVIPLPAPLPSITIHHKSVDAKLAADDFDFGFKSTTVEPHTTAAGYLYYDTRHIDDPVLEGAMLEVRRVHHIGATQEFYAFEIKLHPTPEPPKPGAKPGAPSSPKAKVGSGEAGAATTPEKKD